MDKKEALLEVLKGAKVYDPDNKIIIDYSDFGGGFFSVNGADDGGDLYLEIHTLDKDTNYKIIEE